MGGELGSAIRPLLLDESQEDQQQSAIGETFDWMGRPQSQRKLGGKKTLFFTLGNICLWYTAYFGIYFNMVLFFRNVLDEGTASAANDTNNWLGFMFLSSLLGAFIAESFMGRLWACALFQVVNLMGMVLMTLSATLLLSGNPSSGVVIFFYFSIYLISLGCGAFQPTLQSLGADQFDVDEDKSSFFTRYLVLNNLGIAFGDTVIVYTVSMKGWVFGFWICTGVGAAALSLFLLGLPMYRQYRHHGNPYSRALQVLVAASRKWQVKSPQESDLLYEISYKDSALVGKRRLLHSENLRFLDKAATTTERDQVGKHPRNPWRLCTVTQVEEVKCVLMLLPVWVSSIFFNTVYSQAGTLFVEEGETMNTSAGSFSMQPATMNMFNIMAVVLLPPIYSWCIVPIARRFTGLSRGLSPLQRTGLGYGMSIIALSIAAIVEARRLSIAKALNDSGTISIFWQIPQYILLGSAQFLTGIGQLEFFYTEAPDSLRSLGSSFCLTCIALGDYVSSLLVTIVTSITTRNGSLGWIPKDLNQGHLDYFYWLLAVLTFLNLLFFLWCASSFQQRKRYEEEEQSSASTADCS